MNSSAQICLPKRFKISLCWIVALFFVILGILTYVAIDSSGSGSFEEIFFIAIIIPIISLVFSFQIIGAIYGIPLAFRFAWETVYIWSLILAIIVFYIGGSFGWLFLLVTLIKDYNEYRKIKSEFAIEKEKTDLKIKIKRIALLCICAILLFFLGIGLGYAGNGGFSNVLYSSHDKQSLEMFEFERNGDGYTIWAKDDNLSGDVVIPETFKKKPITEISEYAFSNCDNIDSITMPDTIISIGKYAFKNCTGITEIKLSSNLETIGIGAFINCVSLTSIEIPDSVYEIETDFWGTKTFEGCNALKVVRLGKGITNIKYKIFDECSALDSIYVTSMLAGVENFAFSDCVSLKNIYFTGSVEQWQNVVLGDKAFFEHQYDITVHCTDGEIIIEK